MSGFENAMSVKVDLRSAMMLHEGGTKFYEVLLLQPTSSSPTTNALCLQRWGAMNSKEKGGSFGKGKLLTNSFNAYIDAIIRNKMGRGYRVESEPQLYQGHNSVRIATAYRLINRIGEDEVVAAYFRSLGVDIEDAIEAIDNVAGEIETSIVVEPKQPIVRSPLFGSW